MAFNTQEMTADQMKMLLAAQADSGQVFTPEQIQTLFDGTGAATNLTTPGGIPVAAAAPVMPLTPEAPYQHIAGFGAPNAQAGNPFYGGSSGGPTAETISAFSAAGAPAQDPWAGGVDSAFGQNGQTMGTTPGSAPQTWGQKVGGWLNGNGGVNLQASFAGVQALTGAYLGFQQLKQAKEGLKFQKEAFNANLTNSTQNYNTSLADRINGRTSDYAGKDQDVKSYLAQHSLKRPGG